MALKLKLKCQCQIEGCTSPAKYALFHKVDGDKEWIKVCNMHERSIGDENMRRAGGRYEN